MQMSSQVTKQTSKAVSLPTSVLTINNLMSSSESLAWFDRLSLGDIQALTASESSPVCVDRLFIIALTSAISSCVVKSGPRTSGTVPASWEYLPANRLDLNANSNLRDLKAIGRFMNRKSLHVDEYVDWLEAKVPCFALKHPLFALEFFPERLAAVFSLAEFEVECHRIPPGHDKTTSLSFVLSPAIQTSRSTISSSVSTQDSNLNAQQMPIAPARNCTALSSACIPLPITDFYRPTTPLASGAASLSHSPSTHNTVSCGGLSTPSSNHGTGFKRPQNLHAVQEKVRSQSNEQLVSYPPQWVQPQVENIVQQNHPRPYIISSFQPSRELQGKPHVPSPQRLLQAHHAGVKQNPCYRGDLTDLDIANASCPGFLNCAVRIENICHYASLAEIFDLINEGKVFSFSKKDPVPGRFANCAARLVFCDRSAAEAFVARAQSYEGISLYGSRWHVKWNRDACRPMADNMHHQTRVIRVVGPEMELSMNGLEILFHTAIKFTLVDSREWLIGNGLKLVELEFCSILGQSRIAYKFFHEYMDSCGMRGRFTIGWGVDPCDRSILSTYNVFTY